MPVASLGAEEGRAWQAALDAYAGIAKRSLIFDGGLVQVGNTLAGLGDAMVLPPNVIESPIANALSTAAPIYRAHLWPEHRKEDDEWIAAHCSGVQRYDRQVRMAIAEALDAIPSSEPIVVDLARETGPTLAYTTNGPDGTSGHTVIAPQKNTDPELALNTIFHEISHTMDDRIQDAIVKEATRQRVKVPEDLWHAVTLYTTGEITGRALSNDGRPAGSLDSDRATMFDRNGWQKILTALERDWQPYLDHKVPFGAALQNLVRDTANPGRP